MKSPFSCVLHTVSRTVFLKMDSASLGDLSTFIRIKTLKLTCLYLISSYIALFTGAVWRWEAQTLQLCYLWLKTVLIIPRPWHSFILILRKERQQKLDRTEFRQDCNPLTFNGYNSAQWALLLGIVFLFYHLSWPEHSFPTHGYFVYFYCDYLFGV